MFQKQCSLCCHEKRAQIDAELFAGAATREIAEKYSLSKSAVARHAALHFVHDDTTGQSDAGARQLEDAARRLLAASERKGDRRSALDALKLLHEMQVRRRIAAASVSPDEPQKDPQDLVQQMKAIYGLKDRLRPIQIRVIEDVPKMGDRKLVEQLKGLLERTVDTRPKVAAAATLLASLLLDEELDAETAGEVKNLLAGLGEENHGTAQLAEGANEGERIDADDIERSGASNKYHRNKPDVDDHD